MKTEKEIHLSDEQLLMAMIDGADVSPALQAHLNECAQCCQAKSQIEREFEQLGQTAERFVPVPRRRIVLPLEDSRVGAVRFRQWRTSVAVAATALILIFFVWGSNQMLMQEDNTGNSALENQEAEILIMEVNVLLGEAIPQVYMEICVECELHFNDEFIEFIAPVAADDPLLLISRKKGVQLC